MSKFKIINLIDKLFITCAIFLIIYGWLNFYLRDLWITFLFSLVFSFAVLFVLNYILSKKQNKATLSKKNLEDINKNFLAFCLSPKEEKLSILKKILEKNNIVNLEENNIICSSEKKKTLYVLATEFVVDNKNFIPLICEHSNCEVDEICIICEDVLPNIKTDILKGKIISFLTKTSLYFDYFAKHNIYPNTDVLNTSKLKPKFIDVLKNFFVPSKAKGYFLCGLILIFSSIILPYHYYYIVFGSILLLFSIICKIKPVFN